MYLSSLTAVPSTRKEKSLTRTSKSLPPFSTHRTLHCVRQPGRRLHLPRSRNNWRHDFRVAVQGERRKRLVEMHPMVNSKARNQPLIVVFALINERRVEFVYLHVYILNCIHTCPCCRGNERSSDNGGKGKGDLRNSKINIPESQNF